MHGNRAAHGHPGQSISCINKTDEDFVTLSKETYNAVTTLADTIRDWAAVRQAYLNIRKAHPRQKKENNPHYARMVELNKELRRKLERC